MGTHVNYIDTIRKHGARHTMDVGACIGGWIGNWLDVGAEKLVAVKPIPKLAFKILSDWKHDPRVTVVNAGIADVPGQLKSVNVHNCWTLLPEDTRKLDRALEYRGEAPFDVDLVTIDQLCDQHALAPSFIKIDTDGYEVKALRGARQTLERFRPLVMLEVSYLPKILGDDCEQMIRDAIVTHGYRIQHFLTGAIYTDPAAFMRVYPWHTSFDVFLLPPGFEPATTTLP